MVLLDYAAEEREFYSGTHNAFGLPFIWNYIGNFGGNTHLFAPLQRGEGLAERALTVPNCIGIGCTLEALGVNPVIYEMLLEQPWSENGSVDVPRWVEHYADRRAGRIDANVREAWRRLANDVLAKTARRTGTYGSVFQRMPRLSSWRGRAQNSRLDYAPTDLVAALDKLFEAAPDAQRADGYRYDVVNFTRQALCNFGDQVAARMDAAAAAGDPVQFQHEAASFLALGQDLDELLGTRREFLLGTWLEQARSWAANPAEAEAYEANAREILTSWHEPGGELTDYASRQWNGLMRDYYLRRWEKWISLTNESLKNHTPFPEERYLAWVNDACQKWIHSTGSHYATQAAGNEVATAKRLFLKYHPQLVAEERQTDGPVLVDERDVFALETGR
jgi:alpha-N-acetylglucosaminidase